LTERLISLAGQWKISGSRSGSGFRNSGFGYWVRSLPKSNLLVFGHARWKSAH